MNLFIKSLKIRDYFVTFFLLIIIITMPAATSYADSSIFGMISFLILIFAKLIKEFDIKINFYSIFKQIPFLVFFIYYANNRYGEINIYVLTYVFLIFTSSIIFKYLKKDILKFIYFLFLILGIFQIFAYYLSGLEICFFNYQCEQINRLNFFNGFYRSNSLFFEPGDFSCFSILLSTIAFPPKNKIIITDLAICLITLSAGGLALFLIKLLLYNFNPKSLVLNIKKFSKGLLEKRKLLLITIFSFFLFLLISYLISKGIGTNKDAAFVSRWDVLFTLRNSIQSGKILNGLGFDAYEKLRLVDSLTLGTSVLLVLGLLGLLSLFLSTALITSNIKFSIMLFMSRFSPASTTFLLLIYLFLLFNENKNSKPKEKFNKLDINYLL